jgi:hypothetical protein
MFEPDLTNKTTLPVPLKKIAWSCFGSAQVTNLQNNLWTASGFAATNFTVIDTTQHPDQRELPA